MPFAGVAHLVERDLAKVEVASSSLVARSKNTTLSGGVFCVRLSAHRRVSRLPAATAADSRDTSSKAPRFIRRRRRFGAFLVARSKKNTPSDRMGYSFWKCAAAPENSLPRPARSASNQEVRQGSCEWRQPFVGCRVASSSLVARSKNTTLPGGVFFVCASALTVVSAV